MNIRYVALRLVLAALLLWGIFCGIGHLLGKGATPLDQLSVGGPRWTARTRCTGPSRARTSAPHDRPADRGPSRAHPVTGGAGEQRTGVSAAHTRASTSANSAATSGSSADVKPAGPDCRSPRWSPTPPRCRGAYSSLAHPRPHWPTDQALMTLWRLPRPISILRGFAFSATGIRSRSTPPS